jgi:MFS family permease
MYCVVSTVPLSAQIALNKSGLQAGLLLLPISVLNVVLAPLAGAVSDRVPARYVSTAGAVCFLAGTAVFSQPNNSTIMGIRTRPPKRSFLP